MAGAPRIRIFEGKKRKNGERRFGVDYFEPGTRDRHRDIVGTYDQARRAKAELELEFASGTYAALARGDATLGQLRLLWLDDRGPTKRSISADHKRWEYLIGSVGDGGFVGFFKPDLRLDRISAADVLRFRSWLLTQITRRGKPFRPATVNRALVLGKAAFNLAKKHKLVRENPFTAVDLLPEDNERTRVCSDEEFDKLLDVAPPKLMLAMIIARDCGLRADECARLQWRHVHFDAGKNGALFLPKTKTDRPRTVPMTALVADSLRAWPREEDDLILHITAGGISSEMRSACERTEIVGLVFHDLRATCATRWLRAGASTKVVKDLLGHETYKMLDRYSRLTGGDMLDIAAEIHERISTQNISSRNVKNTSDPELIRSKLAKETRKRKRRNTT